MRQSREATQIAKDESSVTQAILSNAADENAQAKEAYRRWAIEHLAQEDKHTTKYHSLLYPTTRIQMDNMQERCAGQFTEDSKDERPLTPALPSKAAVDDCAQAKEAYRRWAIEHLAQED